MDRLAGTVALAALALASLCVGLWLNGPAAVLAGQAAPPAKSTAGTEQLEAEFSKVQAQLTSAFAGVAAFVNGVQLSQEDIRAVMLPELIRLQGKSDVAKRAKESFDRARRECIDTELAYQDALYKLEQFSPKGLKLTDLQKEEFDKHLRELESQNHLTHEQLLDRLKRIGVSFERLQRWKERKFFADEYLRSRIYPIMQRETTEPYVLKYYERHASELRRSDGSHATMYFFEARDLVLRKLREEIAARENKRIIQDLRSRATIVEVDGIPSQPGEN
jgi:hypothetical protein